MKRLRVLLIALSPDASVCLAPLYLKSFALSKDVIRDHVEIEILNFLVASSDENIRRRIKESGADVVGFSCYPWNMRKVLRICQKIKNRSNLIILGGPQAYQGESIMRGNRCVDLIVNGEGESVFSEVLVRLIRGSALHDIQGTISRRGGIICNMGLPRRLNIDQIPSPFCQDWFDDYMERNFKGKGPVDFVYETMRGCPYRCIYCGWKNHYLHFFSVARVVKDLRYILNRDDVNVLYLCDSNIFIDQDRAERILVAASSATKSQAAPIYLEFNPAIIRDVRMSFLRRLKNVHVAFGLQTMNEDVLRVLGRRWDPQHFRRIFRKISTCCFTWIQLMSALPNDTFDNFIESLGFAIDLDPDVIQVFELEGVPGSQLYDKQEKYGVSFFRNAPHKLRSHRSFSKKQRDEAKEIDVCLTLIYVYPKLIRRLRRFATKNNRRLSDVVLGFVRYMRRNDVVRRFVSPRKMSAVAAGKRIAEIVQDDRVLMQIDSCVMAFFAEALRKKTAYVSTEGGPMPPASPIVKTITKVKKPAN